MRSTYDADRRKISERIEKLDEELDTVRRQRATQRAGRQRNQWPLASIVGYTNAGKSTLFNKLTGAAVLARAGLLQGRRATTHFGSYDWLASLDPTITVERGARYVDDGVVSSAGVSAGIDMAFAVVEKRCGREVAAETARYIEYDWRP